MEENVEIEVQDTYFEEETVEIEADTADDSNVEEESREMEVEDPFASVDIGLTNDEEANGEHADDDLPEDTPQDTETLADGDTPADASDANAKTNRLVQLPLSRIKQIIKLDPDVDRVNAEAVFVITKATEMFLESFAKEIYKVTARSKKKTIQMRDVTTCIDDVYCMQFLEGVFPPTQ